MLLMALLAYTKAYEQYFRVARLLKILLSFFGLFIVAFVIWKLVHEPERIWSIDALRDFALPIILTLTYLPVAYGIALFSAYEQIFVQLKIGPDKSLAVIRYAKRKLILTLGFGLSRIHDTINQIAPDLRRVTTHEDVDRVIEKATGKEIQKNFQLIRKEGRWPDVSALFLSMASLLISLIALLFSMEYLHPHEEHDVIATVLEMKTIMSDSETTNNGELYFDVAFINRGNQTEIIRNITLYFSENENYAQGCTYEIHKLDLLLSKGEKHVEHVIADRRSVFAGKQLWVNIGVTAIAPDADDIESIWPLGQITLAE